MQFHYLVGKAYWAKILGDPVPNYNRDGHEWTIDVSPDADGMKLLKQLKLDDKIKNKGDERGDFIQFKQKEKRADGKANFPITVCDARNRPWDHEVKLGNETLVEVKFKKVEYPGKPTGVYPQAVRVLELKPFVRQEFAPLPEDNQYVQMVDDFNEPVEVEDIAQVEGDPLAG